jgi:hypothetical protein
MKIRIKSNSIRYRLTRSDVADLLETGHLEDRADFGEQALIYSIQQTDDDHLSASFNNNIIKLFMPKSMVIELANTDKVGFENNNKELYLLVEKDFTCLDNVAEDQRDNYPNPLA